MTAYMTQYFDLSPRGSEDDDNVNPQFKARSQVPAQEDELHVPFLEPSPLKFPALIEAKQLKQLTVRNLAKQDFTGATTPRPEGADVDAHSDANLERLRTPARSKKPFSNTPSQPSSSYQTPTRTPTRSRDRTPCTTPRTDRSYSVPSRYQNFTEARREAAGTPKKSRPLSSQEQEMLEIKRKREEVRNLRKFNEKFHKKAILGLGSSVGTGVEPARGLTVPKEFNLSVYSTRSFDRETDRMPCERDWNTSLRTPRTPRTPSRHQSERDLTNPVSPNLGTKKHRTSLSRSASVPAEDFQSAGQRIASNMDRERSTTPSRHRWSPRLTVPQGPSMLDRPSASRSRCSSSDDHQEVSVISHATSCFMSTSSRFEESVNSSRRGRRWTNALTEPQPFELSSSVRSTSVKSRDEREEEEMNAIRSKPFRARPVARSCRESSTSGIPFVEKRPLTVPSDFNLSVERSSCATPRSTSVKSRDEREEEEVNASRSQPFRARPVPRSCRESSSSGITLVEKRPLTVPSDFNLSVSNSERSISRSRREQSEDSQVSTPFKARRIPSGILDGPTFVPKQVDRPLTCPASPLRERSILARERSASCRREVSTDSQSSETFRARQMPDFEKWCFKPSLSTQDLTTPAPPKLGTDDRGSLYKARLEKQLKEEEMEEAAQREFRARPIVRTAPLQEIRPQQPRTPKKDEIDWKAHKKELDLIADLAEMTERAKQAARQKVEPKDQVPVFRARVCPATTYRRGALPEAHERSLTVPDDVELHSAVRSKSREVYDRDRDQRMAEAEEQKRLLEQEKSVQEQHEVFSIRKSQEFKAKPVPDTTYEPSLLPEKRARNLTVPHEPQFAPHTPRSARGDASDKENSVEPYREPTAWQSARAALRKVQK